MASAHRSPWPRRIVLWTIALALLAGVLAWQDYSFSEAAAALATAGPLGIAAVTAFHLVPLVLDAVAWRVLMPSDTMLSLGRASLARWIGEGVGALIPSAQVGGELARLRAGTVLGLPSAVSGATVLVDVTLGVVTQIVYSIAGIVALFLLSSESGGLALQIALGLLGFALPMRCSTAFTPAIAAFRCRRCGAWVDGSPVPANSGSPSISSATRSASSKP